MTVPHEHPADEALELYAMSRLPESEVEPLEEHLLVCNQCQDRLQETDAYLLTIKQALRQTNAEVSGKKVRAGGKFSQFFVLPRPLFAAGLALVALVAVWLPLREPLTQEPFAVALAAVRGAEAAQVEVPAGRPLTLNLDFRGLSSPQSFRVEIADARGATRWQTTLSGQGSDSREVRVTEEFQPGTYWVRVYAEPGADLLREYGLQVTR